MPTGALSTLRARPARRSKASSGGEPSMPGAAQHREPNGVGKGSSSRARGPFDAHRQRSRRGLRLRLNSGQASRTHVHPVAAERHALGVEQAALALALGERPVGADDAVPGHVGVVAGGEHGAREARRAGGDVAVGADEARRGVADAREDASRCGSPGYRRAFVRHGTYSIVAFDPATGEHGAAVHSHWFSVGSLCIWARPGVGAVATQSVVEPAHGPHGLDRLAAGAAAADALDAAARRRRARRGAPGRHRRRGGPGRRPHRRRLHPVRGRRHRRARLRPGQHDGPRDGAGRDGGGLRGRRGRPRRAADGRARRRGGRGRRRPRPPVGGARRRAAARASRGRPASTCGSRTTTSRSRSCGGCCALARAYELAGEADELMASDRAREAGPLYERAAELAPESHELLFWAGLAQAHAGDAERGIAAVRRAIEIHPGWRDAARAALAGLRPRGGARPARAGLELAQQITCRWNARPSCCRRPRRAGRRGPGWRPGRARRRSEKSAELPDDVGRDAHLLTSRLNVTV